MQSQKNMRSIGTTAALMSAFFLGMAPIFGRHAINLGFHPLQVAGLRTVLAAGLLFVIITIFYRKFLYIYPAGLIGCGLAGLLNGIGSLFYYAALGRNSASLGHLLFSLYPFFLAIWLMLNAQSPSRLTIFRIILAALSIMLLVNNSQGIDYIGVMQMIVAAILYAIHIPINQKVLYDVPAPTVTLYTLLAMSMVVFPAYFFFDRNLPTAVPWWPILGLTFVTFFSRLMLFLGVKNLGGMQTALLGLMELLVTLSFSIIWLQESLNPTQWVGAIILAVSVLLVSKEKPESPAAVKANWLNWLRPPQIPPH